MKKIKVIHIVNRFDIGGLENGIVNICNGLNRSLFEPVLCCMKGIGPMAQRLKPDVKVVNMCFAEGKAPFRSLSMARYFKKEKPDIVHAHGWPSGSFDAVIGGRLSGVPVIINGEHGSFHEKPHQKFLQRLLVRICDATLFVSESLKDKVIARIGIPQSRLIVIENGVDMEYLSGKYDTTALRQELRSLNMDITDQTFIVGSVGSLKPIKNQMMLLRALRDIVQRNDKLSITVLFIGDGPDRDMLAKNIVEMELSRNAALLGNRNDIPQWLSLIDVLVSTSVSEGMSNVMLEAMSSGVPVISTGCMGKSAVVCDNINGYLVENNNSEELSKKIELLASNQAQCRAMGGQACTHILKNYSLQKMVSNYEQVYTALLLKRNKITRVK